MNATNAIQARLMEWSALRPPAGAGGDWFDADAYLGKRGHKYQTRGTKLWLSACGTLAGLAGRAPQASLGIALGTNFGAHLALHELESVIEEHGAATLSPSYAPNFCVNLIASHAGIRYAGQRFNLTVTTPQVAGLDALAAAARELGRARCDLAVAGGAEEPAIVRGGAPAQAEGAIAALLARADCSAGGLAILSGFAQLTLAPAAWGDAGTAMRRLREAAQRYGLGADPARWRALVLASDEPALFPCLAQALRELAPGAGAPREVSCPRGHGSLEPLAALRTCLEGARPALFMYAGASGAVRLVGVE